MKPLASLSPAARFVLWAAVGAAGCLAFLTGFTIGFFIAPFAAATALVLLVVTPTDRSLAGVISGLSLPLFYVAWLNREGPGVICHEEPTFTTCSERWSPWPWLAVGVALLAAGIVAFRWPSARGARALTG